MARKKQNISETINDQIDDHVDLKECSDLQIKPGQSFTYHEMQFIVLEQNKLGILAISAKTIDTKMKFAENTDKGSNNWATSSLRKHLNGSFISKFDTNDLSAMKTDLMADTGETDYGHCVDLISIPTDAIFRKYHSLIPNYSSWVWSATPWAINYSTMSAVSVRTQTKTIYSETATKELGVAILCLFKPSVFNKTIA